MTDSSCPLSHDSIQARKLAAQYKELPEKEMKKWEKKAAEDKSRYQDEMKDYVPTEDPTGGAGRKGKQDNCHTTFGVSRHN